MNLIKEVNTKEISGSELLEIGRIQKDMWAYGLGEYVKCKCCNEIHSKNDIFGHLSSDIRKESVTKLEEIYLGDTINCKKCDSTNTEFIFDVNENIEAFVNRYKKKSFLILSYNQEGNINGFCDGYISSFDDIFSSDLYFHYSIENISYIEKIIKEKLKIEDLSNIFFFSSLGTYEKYISYIFLYELLRGLFNSINIGTNDMIGITELDKNNTLYKIYKMMGSLSLGLDESFIKNTKKPYDSDLVVFPNPIKDFRDKYNLPFKDFLKKYKLK